MLRATRRTKVSKAVTLEYIHTYHSNFISEGVAEASRVLLLDYYFYQNCLAIRNTAVVTGGKSFTI
jgi:hypothetical protein